MSRHTINQQIAVAADIHCEKLTWMLIHKPAELEKIQVALTTQEGRKDVENAAAKMFALRNILELEMDKPFPLACVETEEAIEKRSREYIKGASFAVDDLLCRPEYIRVYDDGTLGLFVVHMCLDGEENEDGTIKRDAKKKMKWNEDLSKLSYQYHVLSQLGYKVSSATIYYVNKEYEKETRHIWSDFFKPVEVLDLVEEHQVQTKSALEAVRNLMDESEEPECQGLDANRCINTPCPCFERCKKEKDATDSIVWKIVRLYKRDKCSLVNRGVVTAEQLLHNFENGDLHLNDKQLRQLVYHINNRKDAFYNKDELDKFMDDAFSGASKIVFFDFESYMYVLPKFARLHPYTQLPFQWSAHVLDVETKEITHFEFLGQKHKDPREACARKLLELPHTNDCVWVAYNMGFEKGVIGNLAKHFADEYPDMARELMVVREMFVDLMKPFQNHWLYLNAFEGSYSIKYVLPGLFPNSAHLNYHNLCDIQNGVDAQRGYLQMQTKKGIELRELKKNMLKYCELDTWAMVMVYGYLVEFLANNCEIIDFSEKEIEDLFYIA